MTEEESGIKDVINEARLLKRVNAADSHCHLSVDVITEYVRSTEYSIQSYPGCLWESITNYLSSPSLPTTL
jgi:hypothetical protein